MGTKALKSYSLTTVKDVEQMLTENDIEFRTVENDPTYGAEEKSKKLKFK